MSDIECIVVSAHFDDAVLSFGGHLFYLAGGVRIITLFGGMPAPDASLGRWDRSCGFTSASEATQNRRREDLAACRLLGAVAVHLPHLDRQYIDGKHNLKRIQADLQPLLTPGSRLYVPAAIGNHGDHLTARNVAIQAARSAGLADVWLYADLPYVTKFCSGWGQQRLGSGPDQYGSIVPAITHLPTGLLIHPPTGRVIGVDQWRMKRLAITSYASQLPPLAELFPRLMAFPGMLQYEMTWQVSFEPAICS
jgi:LmbE family N-acetylglucosaminyl deacetylase